MCICRTALLNEAYQEKACNNVLSSEGRKAGLADLCKEYQLAITEEQVNTLKVLYEYCY